MASDFTLLDGGMGKLLRARGAPFRQPEWSALALMEGPDGLEHVVAAHREFIDAGADLITTNNYAVVPFHLGLDRFLERGVELCALAGRLAREAADMAQRPVRVAGSLPPLFGSYEPDDFDADTAPDHLESIAGALRAPRGSVRRRDSVAPGRGPGFDPRGRAPRQTGVGVDDVV